MTVEVGLMHLILIGTLYFFLWNNMYNKTNTYIMLFYLHNGHPL